MRKHFLGTGIIALLMAISALSWTPAKTTKNLDNKIVTDSVTATAQNLFENYISEVYSTAKLQSSNLDMDVFRKAVTGFYNLKHDNRVSKSLITIVDFNRSSREKRLWVVDLINKKILYNTLVAHGQGSGDDMARNFSNTAESHQSSIGFYVTENTYSGKHGLSLRLNGMDQGFNTNALERAVVVHAANYVSESFIAQHGRLGRSFGCPALPPELAPQIIGTIKGRTCLYINGPEATYKSSFLDTNTAASNFAIESTALAKI